MKSRTHTILLLSLLNAVLAQTAFSADIRVGGERRIRLTEDWRFLKGEAAGAEQPAFDDYILAQAQFAP